MTALELTTRSYWRAASALLNEGNLNHIAQVQIYARFSDPRAAKIARAAQGALDALRERFVREVSGDGKPKEMNHDDL